MKNIIRILILLYLILSVIFTACKKELNNTIKIEILTGYAQKGPFTNGYSIQMNELSSLLDQTGKVFSTQIINNSGAFEFSNINLSSQYVEFIANGYYYNEILASLSTAPLSLYALCDVKDISTININILTHLEKNRIKYLVNNKIDFAEAKNKAQKEILSIFNISNDGMDNSEELDITINKEENAILLAISLILQGNKSEADLTQLLANISTDINQDGILNDETIITGLRSSAMGLDLAAIRSNLEERYQELGITVTIPVFEKYINEFLSFTGTKPSVQVLQEENLKNTSVTLNGLINPNSLSTNVIFEYGTTNSYGNNIIASQSPLSGFSDMNVSVNLTGLSEGTTYHYRINATNSSGTTNSDDKIFTTIDWLPGTVVNDYEGNSYSTVLIASQVWMAENLKTLSYNDGTPIPIVDLATWNQKVDAYSWPYNDITKKTIYGALYNWYTVNTGKLCPLSWHVPSLSDWNELLSTLGTFEQAAGKLKSTTADWIQPNVGASDEYGFKALPGGYTDPYGGAVLSFDTAGKTAQFWSSTICTDIMGQTDLAFSILLTNWDALFRKHGLRMNHNFSVRCIKD